MTNLKRRKLPETEAKVEIEINGKKAHCQTGGGSFVYVTDNADEDGTLTIETKLQDGSPIKITMIRYEGR